MQDGYLLYVLQATNGRPYNVKGYLCRFCARTVEDACPYSLFANISSFMGEMMYALFERETLTFFEENFQIFVYDDSFGYRRKRSSLRSFLSRKRVFPFIKLRCTSSSSQGHHAPECRRTRK